ncbi:cytosolic Fe-S cluster assembly factor nbp35 [Conglomerata obtusa]
MKDNCPGVTHEQAGKLDGCKDCPNANFCNAEKVEDPDIQIIKNNMKSAKNIIAVLSGKGGVGKSTITRNVAEEISKQGYKTLILDFDLSGPSIPRLTNTSHNEIFESNNRLYPIEITKTLFCLSVGHFIRPEKESMNSSVKTNIIKKILKETDFTDIDYLIIDTPPGVSDEHLGLINYMKIDQVILITTPQTISINDVRRQYDFCKKTDLKIFGLVENFKKYICYECGHENYIFNGKEVYNFCLANDITYLGSINIIPNIAKNSDRGIVTDNEMFKKISHSIINCCNVYNN